MTTSWLQYWTPKQLTAQGESGGHELHHTAGEQFGQVEPNDVVYVFGREGTTLLLVGRLRVTDVLTQSEVDASLGSDAYLASVHLIGDGTTFRVDRSIPRRTAARLRRASGKQLVDHQGNADGQRLQTVSPLSPESVVLLDRLLDRDDVRVSVGSFREGTRRERIHRQIERHPGVRDAALRLHGTDCQICDMSFEAVYGDRGAGFAEVHHLLPLGELQGKSVLTNPATDVIVVCANCHRMLHRGPHAPIGPDVLRAELRQQ